MLTRILTAVIGIPLLVLVISLGGIPLLLSVIIVTSIGLYELYNTVKINGQFNMNVSLEMVLSLFLLLIMKYMEGWILPFLILIFTLHFIYQLFAKDPSFFNGLLGFFGITYISLLFGHLLLFERLIFGNYLIWLVFLTAWSTDTFAYFTGFLFGKRKLCPHISPKKTIEGAIGGILGSFVMTMIFAYYLRYFHGINVELSHIIILSIFSSIISQFGDLTASIIKRYFGVKDFGKIFPGHGGVLDRFDSILFTAPFVYYYISFFIC